MPVGRRLVAATAVSGVLLTGLCLAASADPIIPGVPTPVDDLLNPGATTSASSTATPTSTASSTATPTATATSSESATPTATATTTATATPTGTPTSGPDADGLLSQPRTGCVQFTDPAGDATTNPVSGAVGDPDDDLDIINVVYKTTSTALQVFVKETKLDQAPTSTGGFIYDTHSFSTGFTLGGKVITLTAGATGPATATVGGAASTALKPTATFDIGHSNIVFSVSRAELSTLIGQDVLGASATALSASSAAESSFGLPSMDADDAAPASTAPAAQKTYVVGDNNCFRPPAGVLTIGGPLKGVYTDLSTVTATIKDADGKPVAGAPIRLQLTGVPAQTRAANANGLATFTFVTPGPDGMKALTATFAGAPGVGGAVSTAYFAVRAESTLIKAVSSRGAVTATLTDNEHQPIAYQTLVFTVGKKVTKIRTNAKGVAVLTRQAKGATAKVAFGVVPRFYYAAKPVLVKVA